MSGGAGKPGLPHPRARSTPAGGTNAGLADLTIAATAIAADLPLFTTNPEDFGGLERILSLVAVTRPSVPHDA
jgi:hypothetical protein